jgi:gamma-glutamylcyclotransferase (GGCT)/AIG2-like uncharacterized protein YtfP
MAGGRLKGEMPPANYAQLARALRLWSQASDRRDALGAVAAALGQTPSRDLQDWIELASHRLAVYGTLAPGKSNHGQLAGLGGNWSRGFVRGTLRPAGWAQTLGYPGLIWNPAGERVAVQLFESRDLPQHWNRLDEFEGEDYQRLLIPVEQQGNLLAANIYAFVRGPGHGIRWRLRSSPHREFTPG